MSTTPLACTLTADQQRCDAATLLPALQSGATTVEWFPAGATLTFDATSENLAAILRTIDRERHCCAFFTFVLTVPADMRQVVLEMRGPEGTRAFLEQLGIQATDADA